MANFQICVQGKNGYPESNVKVCIEKEVMFGSEWSEEEYTDSDGIVILSLDATIVKLYVNGVYCGEIKPGRKLVTI